MIRVATETDVPAILELYAPFVLTTTATFEYDVPCRKDFMQRFLTITENFPWLVWEEEGKILGYAYASYPYSRAAYRWCAEPSIYIAPEAQGKGIGRKLYAALEAILVEQGIQTLYSIITGENDGSVKFHERLGYVHRVTFPNCGYKFGRWISVIWMEKRLISVEIPKSFPTPFRILGQDKQRISDILDSLSLS